MVKVIFNVVFQKNFLSLFRQSNHNHVENISGAIMLKESLLSDNFALGK